MLGRNKFTLIEMLIAITIFLILIAMLLPILHRTKAVSRAVVCNSNLRQLGTTFLLFAKDNDGYLPGNSGHNLSLDGPERWQQTWMGKESNFDKYDGPKTYFGTITDYAGGPESATGLYRCPSLEAGKFRTYSSNGKFDYVSVQKLTGAKLIKAPMEMKYNSTMNGESWVRSFMVAEEEPQRIPGDAKRGLNAGDSSPGFGGKDRLGTWHNETTAYYVSFDGSVASVENLPLSGPGANSIKVETPKGDTVSLSGDKSWGWWNNQ